jgi:hypothetical protein
LIELDRLREENDHDEELIRESLGELYDSIENGEGVWAVIPGSKRAKIQKRIDNY